MASKRVLCGLFVFFLPWIIVTFHAIPRSVSAQASDITSNPINHDNEKDIKHEDKITDSNKKESQNVNAVNEGTSGTFVFPNKTHSQGALMRGFYVFLAICIIVVIYIAYRTFRLRRRQTIRKYRGSSRGSQEVLPLASQNLDDDDDDDDDIFNASDLPVSKG